MKFRCIKTFEVDNYDGDGFGVEKSSTIENNSVWVVDDSDFRCVGADIRLLEDVEGSLSWLEISKEKFKTHFEKVGE